MYILDLKYKTGNVKYKIAEIYYLKFIINIDTYTEESISAQIMW